MRPVDKGQKPKQKFKEYREATPVLEKRIGSYCSYCEFPIVHVPELEHVVSKTKGGEINDWDNFLLGCKYCNSRKNANIDLKNRDEYLWPHEYNTFMAYTYTNGIPKVNSNKIENDIAEKAENLFKLVKLDNIPYGKEKDKRFEKRYETMNNAHESRAAWDRYSSMQETAEVRELKEGWLEQTINLAKEKGFFSVWMEAFQDIPLIRNRLIDAFAGTNRKCFDSDGNPKWWCKDDDSN